MSSTDSAEDNRRSVNGSCGLVSSLFSNSCRGRAEAFARRLHRRLKSLGSSEAANNDDGTEDDDDNDDDNDNESVDESHVHECQPRHNILKHKNDLFYDLNLSLNYNNNSRIGSLSPDDEVSSVEFTNLLVNHPEVIKINEKDNLNCPEEFYKQDNVSLSPDELFEGEKCRTDEETLAEEIGDGLKDVYGDDERRKETDPSTDDPLSLDSNNSILTDESLWNTFDDSSLIKQESTAVNCNHNDSNLPNCSDKDDHSPYSSTLNISEPLVVQCPLDKQCQIPECEIILKNEISIEIEDNDKSNQTVNDDDNSNDNDSEDTPRRLRRCSSLKTGKTPPGTPGRKKIVRFADVLGLDLADVRTFLDEIPKVPNSAYSDLIYDDVFQKDSSPGFYDNTSGKEMNDLMKISSIGSGLKTDRTLVPLFQQPGGMPNFMDFVRDRFVCLENIIIQDPILMCLVGTVRVKNIDFHKSVHIRYTLDSWRSYSDLQALYLNNSCDGFSDKFSFQLYCHTLKIGDRLEMAVRFQCKGTQYWDNNCGSNYCFQCLSTTPSVSYIPITTSHHISTHDWSPTFY